MAPRSSHVRCPDCCQRLEVAEDWGSDVDLPTLLTRVKQSPGKPALALLGLDHQAYYRAWDPDAVLRAHAKKRHRR